MIHLYNGVYKFIPAQGKVEEEYAGDPALIPQGMRTKKFAIGAAVAAGLYAILYGLSYIHFVFDISPIGVVVFHILSS